MNRLGVEGEMICQGTIDSVSYSNFTGETGKSFGQNVQVRKKEDAKYKKELLVFFCACLTGVNVRAGYDPDFLKENDDT